MDVQHSKEKHTNKKLFRGYTCGQAGLYNDQAMLHASHWNQHNTLNLGPTDQIGADGGYFSTDNLTVVTPANVRQLRQHPHWREFNTRFNAKRVWIEQRFGALKGKYNIFMDPWRRAPELFPEVLECVLKLLNFRWELDG